MKPHPNPRVLGAVLLALLPAAPISADGSDTLAPPVDFYLASGTGFAHSGTSLQEQPETIVVDVPRGARVKQVLLYWKHRHEAATADNKVIVNGHEVAGKRIGGPTRVARAEGGPKLASAFRQDITNLDIVHQGRNLILVDGLHEQETAGAGAGIVVVYDSSPKEAKRYLSDDNAPSRLLVKDGLAAPSVSLGNDSRAIKPVTFEFPSTRHRRFARLGLMVGDVRAGTRSRIGYWTDADRKPVVLTNVLASTGSAAWASLNLDFEIPAGAKKLTIAITGDSEIGWVGAFLHLTKRRPMLLSSVGMPPEYWAANPLHWGRHRPQHTVSQVFGRAVFEKHHAELGKQTLLQALSQTEQSGWPRKLVRRGLAALFSAQHGGVHFPLDDQSIVNLVRRALESGDGNDISWEAVSAIKILTPRAPRAVAQTSMK